MRFFGFLVLSVVVSAAQSRAPKVIKRVTTAKFDETLKQMLEHTEPVQTKTIPLAQPECQHLPTPQPNISQWYLCHDDGTSRGMYEMLPVVTCILNALLFQKNRPELSVVSQAMVTIALRYPKTYIVPLFLAVPLIFYMAMCLRFALRTPLYGGSPITERRYLMFGPALFLGTIYCTLEKDHFDTEIVSNSKFALSKEDFNLMNWRWSMVVIFGVHAFAPLAECIMRKFRVHKLIAQI